MLAQVLGEVVDALGQQGDLDLGVAGVALVGAELRGELALAFAGDAGIGGTVADPGERTAVYRRPDSGLIRLLGQLARALDVAAHLLDQRLRAVRSAAPRAGARGSRRRSSLP